MSTTPPRRTVVASLPTLDARKYIALAAMLLFLVTFLWQTQIGPHTQGRLVQATDVGIGRSY